MQSRFSSFLGPRVVIYSIVVLAMAWVFWRQESRMTPSAVPSPAPEEKVWEGTPVHSLLPQPLLMALGTPEMREKVEAVVKLAEESPELRNVFMVVSVILDEPESVNLYLQVFQCQEQELPLAILFDAQGEEIRRGPLPKTKEELEAFR